MDLIRYVRAGLLLATVGFVATWAGQAHALPGYVETRYNKTALPTTITYECTDCHITDDPTYDCNVDTLDEPWSPCFNPFGTAYRASGWSEAVGNQDVDGDLLTNKRELSGARLSSGFPRGAEGVCDMFTCAASSPEVVKCGRGITCKATRVRGQASTGRNGFGYGYKFTFGCEAGRAPLPAPDDAQWGDNCLTPTGTGGTSGAGGTMGTTGATSGSGASGEAGSTAGTEEAGPFGPRKGFVCSAGDAPFEPLSVLVFVGVLVASRYLSRSRARS